jgi:hypothetical protein
VPSWDMVSLALAAVPRANRAKSVIGSVFIRQSPL